LPIVPGADGAGDDEDSGFGSTFDTSAPGYRADGLESEGGGSGRYMAIAVVLLLLAFAVYYWKIGSVPPAPEPAQQDAVQAAPPQPDPVEVVVRTDVEGSELHIDGASYGVAQDDRWMLDLPPGPHRLEARADGNVVASSLVTLREGIPATVFLSMPELKVAEADGGVADDDAGEAELSDGEKRRLAREKAREERRRRRERTTKTDGGAARSFPPKPKPLSPTSSQPTPVD